MGRGTWWLRVAIAGGSWPRGRWRLSAVSRRRSELLKQLPDLLMGMPCRQAGVVIEQEWNQRYAGSNQIWSGQPNQALVTEVSELPPGRALDVGCGEGADAVWLAQRGWDVTGLDVSGVALDRARLHARDAGVVARWVRAGLVEAGLPDRGFDLVSAQYSCTPPTMLPNVRCCRPSHPAESCSWCITRWT